MEKWETIEKGPFKPTWESLRQYECPDWFRDAKLGIWAHWGPQSVPMYGDWYARICTFKAAINIIITGGYTDILPNMAGKMWSGHGKLKILIQTH